MNNSTLIWPTDVLDGTQVQVIAYVDIATSTLSILGAGSIIISALWRRRICTPEVQPIFHLSCADFMASLGLFIGAVLYTQQRDVTLDGICPYLTAFTCAFFFSTYFLTTNYAFEVYRRMKERLKRKNKTKTSCGKCSFTVSFTIYTLAWVVPICVTAIAILNTQHSVDDAKLIVPPDQSCHICLPMFHYIGDMCLTFNEVHYQWNLAFKIIFLSSLCLVFSINLVFYILAIRAYRESLVTRGVLGYQQYKDESRIRNKAIFYQLVFFLCWLPSLILGCLSLTSGFKMKDYYWLYILQAAVSPLQGFFNCVVYGWQRQGFKQALSEETKSLTSTNIPTYSTYNF